MNYFCVYCFHVVFYLCVRGGLGGGGYVIGVNVSDLVSLFVIL